MSGNIAGSISLPPFQKQQWRLHVRAPRRVLLAFLLELLINPLNVDPILAQHVRLCIVGAWQKSMQYYFRVWSSTVNVIRNVYNTCQGSFFGTAKSKIIGTNQNEPDLWL
jgi:hypothetical protein